MNNEFTNIYGISEFLIGKVKSNLINAEPTLYLSVTGDYWWRADVYTRVYFRQLNEDGKEVFYMSTDEPPNGDFLRPKSNPAEVLTQCFDSFEKLVNDLMTNTIPTFYKETIHGPPPYVHYDISFAADHIKLRMLNHLENEISGYSDDYFEKHFGEFEKLRIKLWKDWLK